MPASTRKSKVNKTANIGSGCAITESSIGKYTYIGDFTTISTAKVGAFCSISGYCGIGGGSHPLTMVSSSPIFLKGRNRLGTHFFEFEYEAHKMTVIGNDVWIGAHALIKSGVTIADGAVIGMGAVVTHDVGPYEIWAGNPVRLIRKRFDDETIQKLQESKWWEWSDEKLHKYASYFDRIDHFFAEVEKEGAYK